MPVINVGTSPLTSAREWRGVSLVVAARSSGLALTQAEALESGDLDAFGSVDEMVASAVVYSASLGIGRDEAMALLDRTIAATRAASAAYDEIAAAPPEADGAVDAGVRAFSAAVQGRNPTTVQHVGEDLHDDDLLVPMAFDNRPAPLGDVQLLDEADVLPEIEAVQLDGPASSEDVGVEAGDRDAEFDTGELPLIVASDPRIQAAIDADPAWQAAFERSSGELEAWVAHRENEVGRGTKRLEDVVAPLVGRERAEKFAAATATGLAAIRTRTAQLRGRLEQSERATLVVAVLAGVVLIGLLWLVTSIVGGNGSGDAVTPAVAPKATTSKATATTAKSVTKSTSKATAAAATPELAVGKTRVQVLNSGHRSGVAAATAAKLKSLGYPIASVGNTQVRYPRSVVLYQPRFRREAQRLAKQLGTSSIDALPAGTGSTPLTYVIV